VCVCVCVCVCVKSNNAEKIEGLWCVLCVVRMIDLPTLLPLILHINSFYLRFVFSDLFIP
jgi:hypothetical protein